MIIARPHGGGAYVLTVAAQLLGRVGAMAANLCAMALIARALPQDQFGIYVLATGLVTVLAQVADFGTGPVFGQLAGSLEGKASSPFLKQRTKTLLSVESATARTKVFCFFFAKKKSLPILPGSLWGSFLLLRAALATLATALGLAVSLTFTGPARVAMVLASLSVACVAARFLDPLYQVANRAWRSTATLSVGALCMIGFAGLAWAIHPTLAAFLWGFIAANAAYAGAAWLAARDLIDGPARLDLAALRRMATLAAPIGVAGLLTAVNGRANLLFLAHDRGPAGLATYGAATRVLDLAVNFAVVILGPLIPILSRRAAQGAAPLAAEARRLTRLLLRLVMPVLLAAPLLTAPLVRALYGARYADAAPVLAVLALVGAGLVFSLLASYTLLALRVSRYAIPITAAAALLNLALNAMLVPRYGAMGAAVAAACCEAALVGLVWVALARHLPGAVAWEMGPFLVGACVAWRFGWWGVVVMGVWGAGAQILEERKKGVLC